MLMTGPVTTYKFVDPFKIIQYTDAMEQHQFARRRDGTIMAMLSIIVWDCKMVRTRARGDSKNKIGKRNRNFRIEFYNDFALLLGPPRFHPGIDPFISLRYTNGDSCGGKDRMAVIELACGNDDGPSFDQEYPMCEYFFSWKTKIACPFLQGTI